MQRMCCVTAPISAFLPTPLPSPLAASTPRGWSNVYVSASAAAAGRHGSPERSVLSDIYVRLSSLRARTRPICRLGCQPSPSSQQVFCAVLCVTVSARLVLGEVADCFGFHPAHSSAKQMPKRTCSAEARLKGLPTRRQSAGHVFIPIMRSQTSFTDYNVVLCLQIPWIHVSTITNLAVLRDVSLIPRVALMNACDISEAHFLNVVKPPQPPPPWIIHCVYLLYLMDHCVEIPNTMFCLFFFFLHFCCHYFSSFPPIRLNSRHTPHLAGNTIRTARARYLLLLDSRPLVFLVIPGIIRL